MERLSSYLEVEKKGALKMMPLELYGEEVPRVRTYWKSELAAMYRVSPKTFTAWLDRFIEQLYTLGYKRTSKKLEPKIVALIFDRLGEP